MTERSDDLILRAAAFACQAHGDLNQRRKYSGDPYVRHPGRVAARASVLPQSDSILVAAAWLHDTLEDTVEAGTTEEGLRDQFGDEVTELVIELTNRYTSEAYPDRNRAARKEAEFERLKSISRPAKRIKLLDRIDNLTEIDPGDGFIRRYLPESRQLLEAVGDGDADLASELENLIDTLESCLRGSDSQGAP